MINTSVVIQAQTTQRTCGSAAIHLELLKNDSQYRLRRESIEKQAKAKNHFRSNKEIQIPVVVHVLYHTAAENISDSIIQSQLDALNRDFGQIHSSKYSQASKSKIRFVLAKSDPQGYRTKGITRTYTEVEKFQTGTTIMYNLYGGKNAWPSAQYLNIWVGNVAGVLGYAYMPGSYHDGVVINYKYFGIHTKAPYNLGRTATHEVGHWLNLYHIWGLHTGCEHDDEVDDTPNSADPNFGCKTEHTSCGGTDMIENFMDYGDDACMYVFTKGQVDRMEALFEPGGFRHSMVDSKGLFEGRPLPCENGIQDQDERGIDCGGICDACPTCHDGIKNGNETNIDCGGSCATCPTCSDGIKNGNEIGIDCGGICEPCNCQSLSTYSEFDFIESLQLNDTISHTGQNPVYYENKSKYFTLYANVSNYLKIIPSKTALQVQEYYAIWIDWNKDGSFIGNSELVYNKYGIGLLQDSFILKVKNQTIGDTFRMRVQMKWGENITSGCDTLQFGEVENYPIILRSKYVDPCTNGIQDTNENGIDCGPYCSPCAVSYCSSKSKNSKFEFIRSITINGHLFESGNTNGYQDHSNHPVLLENEKTIKLNVEAGFAGHYVLNEFWIVYIDWNVDGDFEDSNELVYKKSSFSKSVYIEIPLPDLLQENTYKMRIIMSDAANTSACGEYNFGETEDFMFNLKNTNARQMTNKKETIQIKVFPNPTTSYFTLTSTSQEIGTKITVVNTFGQIIYQTDQIQTTSHIDCSNWPRGFYTILYHTPENKLTKKLIVQ